MLQYYIEIVGGLEKDLELYNKLQPYKGNLINLGDKVWIYGKATPTALVRIILTCLEYANLKNVEIIRLDS